MCNGSSLLLPHSAGRRDSGRLSGHHVSRIQLCLIICKTPDDLGSTMRSAAACYTIIGGQLDAPNEVDSESDPSMQP